jgi:hypothetical protein
VQRAKDLVEFEHVRVPLTLEQVDFFRKTPSRLVEVRTSSGCSAVNLERETVALLGPKFMVQAAQSMLDVHLLYLQQHKDIVDKNDMFTTKLSSMQEYREPSYSYRGRGRGGGRGGSYTGAGGAHQQQQQQLPQYEHKQQWQQRANEQQSHLQQQREREQQQQANAAQAAAAAAAVETAVTVSSPANGQQRVPPPARRRVVR